MSGRSWTPAPLIAQRYLSPSRWAAREGVSCYRLYDRDIPEVPLTIDRYADDLVLPDDHLPQFRLQVVIAFFQVEAVIVQRVEHMARGFRRHSRHLLNQII